MFVFSDDPTSRDRLIVYDFGENISGLNGVEEASKLILTSNLRSSYNESFIFFSKSTID